MTSTLTRQRPQNRSQEPSSVLAAQQLLPALGNQDLLGLAQPAQVVDDELDPGPWLPDASFGVADFLVGLRDGAGPGLGSAAMLAQSFASSPG